MDVFMLSYFCETYNKNFSKCYLCLLLGIGPSQLCLQIVQPYVFHLDVWLEK